METEVRTLQVTLPITDAAFLRKQSRRMGWQITTLRPNHAKRLRKQDITQTAGFKEAMEDVKNGRVTHYTSTDDMFQKLGIEL